MLYCTCTIRQKFLVATYFSKFHTETCILTLFIVRILGENFTQNNLDVVKGNYGFYIINYEENIFYQPRCELLQHV